MTYTQKAAHTPGPEAFAEWLASARPCHSIHCRHYDLADGRPCEVERFRVLDALARRSFTIAADNPLRLPSRS